MTSTTTSSLASSCRCSGTAARDGVSDIALGCPGNRLVDGLGGGFGFLVGVLIVVITYMDMLI
jgi:hypothetical protein